MCVMSFISVTYMFVKTIVDLYQETYLLLIKVSFGAIVGVRIPHIDVWNKNAFGDTDLRSLLVKKYNFKIIKINWRASHNGKETTGTPACLLAKQPQKIASPVQAKAVTGTMLPPNGNFQKETKVPRYII